MGALVFGSYGSGMFLASPFLVGAITGYLANRNGDIGVKPTGRLVGTTMLLGAITLLLVALEGLICIVMATPIVLPMALVGGRLGRACSPPDRDARQGRLCVALRRCPSCSLWRKQAPAPSNTIRIPEQASRSARRRTPYGRFSLRTDLSQEPVSLPSFASALRIPVRGEVLGRRVSEPSDLAKFSLELVRERVTEWAPNSRLAFVFSRTCRTRELSPYAHVYAPHSTGYFRTTSTSFEL